MFVKKPISLVLGGGGARGLAHIGVLRVLEKNKIPIAQIVGTSMGAIVGGAYAQLKDINAVENKFYELLKSNEYKANGMLYSGINKVASGWFEHIAHHIRDQIALNIANFRESVFSSNRLYKVLEAVLINDQIENTKIPFTAIATDLLKGKAVYLNKGSIIEAVSASSALPGYFPPVNKNGFLLVDGAFSFNVPIRPAKNLLPNTKVIAVDVSDNLSVTIELENSIDIVLRSYIITFKLYHDILVKEADTLISPRVGSYHWSEFDKIKYFINEGEKTAENNLDQILSTCKKGFF